MNLDRRDGDSIKFPGEHSTDRRRFKSAEFRVKCWQVAVTAICSNYNSDSTDHPANGDFRIDKK